MTENNSPIIKIGANVPRETPKVSIITPTYNLAHIISETLDSAFAQTFQDFELIVVNDASPDTPELEKVLEKYADKITYCQKIKNAGVAAARNTGLKIARGELVSFLESDDIWMPNFLASQIAFLQKNKLEMVYSDAFFFEEPTLEGKRFSELNPSKGDVTTLSLLKKECCPLTSASVIKKSWLEKVGFFDEQNFRADDFDMWVRLAKNGAKIGYQSDVLAKYRVRIGSLSGNTVQTWERELANYAKLQEKLVFSDEEKTAIEAICHEIEAELSLARGKAELFAGNYKDASKDFEKARSHKDSLKLQIIQAGLKIAPNLVRRSFERLRSAEIKSMPKR